MFRAFKSLVLTVAFAGFAGMSCGAQGEAPSTLWVVGMDLSASDAPQDQRFFVEYLEIHLLPEIHPGDRLIMGKIGSSALSSFQVLADQCFPSASYQAPSLFSWRYLAENVGQAQAQCVQRYNEFEKQLKEFHKPFEEALRRPATDTQTCLLDTIWLLAASFARHKGPNVLVITSDGLEECRGLNFARRAPTSETVAKLKFQSRIPKLTGVDVYFVCRSSHPPYSYEAVDSFWKAFFQAAGAKSTQVCPMPEIDHATAATRIDQCGR